MGLYQSSMKTSPEHTVYRFILRTGEKVTCAICKRNIRANAMYAAAGNHYYCERHMPRKDTVLVEDTGGWVCAK